MSERKRERDSSAEFQSARNVVRVSVRLLISVCECVPVSLSRSRGCERREESPATAAASCYSGAGEKVRAVRLFSDVLQRRRKTPPPPLSSTELSVVVVVVVVVGGREEEEEEEDHRRRDRRRRQQYSSKWKGSYTRIHYKRERETTVPRTQHKQLESLYGE